MIQKLEGREVQEYTDFHITAKRARIMHYWPGHYRLDARETGKFIPDHGEKMFFDSVHEVAEYFASQDSTLTKYSVSEPIIYRGPMTGYEINLYRG